MVIESVHFSQSPNTQETLDLGFGFAHTVFVISHKSEPVGMLLEVLWQLPVSSSIIVVTNCPEVEWESLARALAEQFGQRQTVYLVHQKDGRIANYFQAHGASSILGPDARVVDGKGEGMYIGTLFASLLCYPKWIIFYDADNFAPSALDEYTQAITTLFLTARIPTPIVVDPQTEMQLTQPPYLHNVRICWPSKPALGLQFDVDSPPIVGRCTRVVSPLVDDVVKAWFGNTSPTIWSSNAGEQGMTVETARALHFSSGFSIETFQLLELLFRTRTLSSRKHPATAEGLMQQYHARSPHVHEKKDELHIHRMIAQSLGCFLPFERFVPYRVKRQIKRICADLGLELARPTIYPPLETLPLDTYELQVDDFAVSTHYEQLA